MSQKHKKIILQYKSRREMTEAIGRMRQMTRDFMADIQTITNSYGGHYGR
ncbi:MAG: hypothetical protein PHD53_00875 [Methylococcales bacterium]|nr:hypothetical protein [Methylococcales bacterium]